MYQQVEKLKENRSSAVANSAVQKKSNGEQSFSFVDNRSNSLLQLHKKLSGSVKQLSVIQFTINGLIEYVKDNEQKKFAALLRSMDPGMDELISCEVAFKLARNAYVVGDMAEVRDICERAHETRFETKWTGAREVSPGGKETACGNPTATVATMPDHPYDMEVGKAGTHYRSTGHGKFNRERAAEVLAEQGGAAKQQGVAISFTLRHVAPPFASGVKVKDGISEAEKDEANDQRDALKVKHPDHDPSSTQPRNAPWLKGPGVSPLRMDPDNSDSDDN